ncbi:LLM class flavin-dependent oxidoreductase [Terriglobus roseus]|uniref:Luciferase-like monooxygenase n=1 Tax=Terriglobus roseus TaxID=392734 RepID=A0A1H4KAI3_9BACT|nr:LLM class flavin-dependent oxidoreductase [Terriglobus roseus]SEB55155.1 luciferase family oxidoreductase, group 1 [Terriglobus roseus]
MSSLRVSVLDLVGMKPGETAGSAIARTVETAQHVERLGYTRFWLAEHHSIAGLACSATSVLIGHVAQQTSTIRVGSGGVMLPNHAPLVVAEQFGTLASIYSNRIDLGLGRAPGSDQPTMRAMRRDLRTTGDDFPELVAEVQQFLGAPRPGQIVHAIPGEGTRVPITLLGSSGFSAQLAGQMGLPFAFAAHFAPQYAQQAMELYRSNFRPSEWLDKPYAMAGLPVLAADTDAQAKRLLTTPQQRFLSLVRNQAVELKPPVESMDGLWNAGEREAVEARLALSVVGDAAAVKARLQRIADWLGLDEILAVTDTYDQADRLRSYEILAEVAKGIEVRAAVAA